MIATRNAVFLCLALSFGSLGSCGQRAASEPPPVPSATTHHGTMPAGATPSAEIDTSCSASIARLLQLPSLPGAPQFDRLRVHVLGRARGEPMVFVREPRRPAPDALPEPLRPLRELLDRGPAGSRVIAVSKKLAREPDALRALLLPEGYVYAADPLDALALVANLRLPDLYQSDELWLMRRAQAQRLVRAPVRGAKCTTATCPSRMLEYRYAEGPQQGSPAELLFGDRFATDEQGLAAPLHRDLRALAVEQGFTKAAIVHRTEQALVADLQYGDWKVRARLDTQGAGVQLGCLEASEATRKSLDAWRAERSKHLRALPRIEQAVDRAVDEALRFDRPEGVKHAELDGKLRPVWWNAYRRKQPYFSYDGVSYAVYDASGRAWPPQVCVDLVLDTYERASGTWFTARGEAPRRVTGGLDFDTYGIVNRRGVLAFEQFASKHPELFETRRFEGAERIQFGERTMFFEFLAEHSELFRAADVVAIQGRKRDGLIHQHAIFVEATDPITGFPYGLFDQMKRPRRRTWEGIMAEAPARSLLYRVRPTDRVFEAIVGAEATTPGQGREELAGASD